MAKKFIPNGDADFASMAQTFALGVANAPERYGVSVDESLALTAAVERFRQALTDTRFGGRSAVATAKKEAARAETEKLIRRIGHTIRTNPAIDAAALIGVGMRERSTSPKVERVPHEPPTLRFVRAIHEEGNAPIHELIFEAKDGKARPAGATRIELFVDLIPADAPVLSYYDKGGRSRPIYVRSYTKGPIRIVPPMAEKPMRVVYFARWADASGDVGPISKAAMGWVEGGTHHLMHFATDMKGRPRTWNLIADDESRSHETTVVVALIAASQLTDARPQVRQIEGPIDAAA